MRRDVPPPVEMVPLNQESVTLEEAAQVQVALEIINSHEELSPEAKEWYTKQVNEVPSYASRIERAIDVLLYEHHLL